jgi:2-polyprenyl-3-methyl-5-hydroxy-6-metoxy-1,4-benzoquinol methylase
MGFGKVEMFRVLASLSLIVQKSRWLSRVYWLAKYIWKDPYEVGETAHGRYLDVLSMIPAEAQTNVLELGCGEGIFTALLADRAVRITASDISMTAIHRAKKRLRGRSNVQCCVQNLCNDPLCEDEYSIVICMELLYYLPYDSLNECIAKIYRAVARGGYLLLEHRRERPQDGGLFTIPFGAETIHTRLKKLGPVICVRELDRSRYLLSLFKRIE